MSGVVSNKGEGAMQTEIHSGTNGNGKYTADAAAMERASIRKPRVFAKHLESAVTWLDLAMATPADELLESPEPQQTTWPVTTVHA